MSNEAYDFSFSGLKTAVLRATKQYDEGKIPVADMAASFQAAVVETLVSKTAWAAVQHGVTAVHLAGGVAANSQLRQAMAERFAIPVRPPPPTLCTDNAAMIRAAAPWRFLAGQRDALSLDVLPTWAVGSYS
jgi:N6-L-threonylcarbamoyladenine synthase